MATLPVDVNVGKEIAEISSDFANPIEVVREALHNAHDAGATEVRIRAVTQRLPDARRVLNLEFIDDGFGMNENVLAKFFGLGFSDKPSIPGRRLIGFKGHGTKIYYQSQDLFVASKTLDGPLVVAVLRNARTKINQKQIPDPEYFIGPEAENAAKANHLNLPREQGTVVRLVDFTPDSSRLIDGFKKVNLENYIRWFTVYGSFEHVVRKATPTPPFKLYLQGTGDEHESLVDFGHPLPPTDSTDLKSLKKHDDRRPFNYFSKLFRFPQYEIEDGYSIDVLMLFEGRRARLDRDKCISRQRAGGLYTEEERYGIWLCKDFIPVERRFEWLLDDECPHLTGDLGRPLVFVNSQDFQLIANRGSVGNSSQQLLSATRAGVFRLLEQVQDDKELERFLNEYQEDLFSRQREKDQKALVRRIERFNTKHLCTITLPGGKAFEFFEPKREITFFGLLSQLQVLAPTLLQLEILDYDDHVGIDMLVRKNGNPHDLLDKGKVAYVEVKYVLGSQVNHAFDHLSAVVCWDVDIKSEEVVADAANNKFQYEEHKTPNGTICRLVPLPDDKLIHTVRVIRLKQLLTERFSLVMKNNPRPVSKTSKNPS